MYHTLNFHTNKNQIYSYILYITHHIIVDSAFANRSQFRLYLNSRMFPFILLSQSQYIRRRGRRLSSPKALSRRSAPARAPITVSPRPDYGDVSINLNNNAGRPRRQLINRELEAVPAEGRTASGNCAVCRQTVSCVCLHLESIKTLNRAAIYTAIYTCTRLLCVFLVEICLCKMMLCT